MKKVTFFACLFLVLLAQVVFAQQQGRRNNAQNEGGQMGGGPGGGMFRMFGEARTEDGKIDLSKLPAEIDAQIKKALTEADKNKDKFLDREEMLGAMQTIGPMMGGMMGGGPGGPGGGMFRMFGEARTEDGRIDLSKLPAEIDAQIKKALTEADKNKDKFLDREELQNSMQTLGPMMGGGPGGPGGGIFRMFGDARTEDGKIDLSKLPAEMDERVKMLFAQADSNKDGFIDQEETMAIMQAFGPMMGGFFGGMGPGGMGQPNPLGEALTEDSRVQISKLPKNFDLMGKKTSDMKKADKNKDGYLNVEEMKAAFPDLPEFFYNRDAPRPQRGGFNRGPAMPGGGDRPEGQRGQNRRGGDSGNSADPLAAAKTSDGKIDLSKLPGSINATLRRNIQAADLNKDGFLDESEQKSISLK